MNIKPIMIKEFRQILRDRTSLGILIFIPAFLLVMFGYALNFDVKHIPLVVVDYDNSSTSRDFINSFTHSEFFDLMGYVQDPSSIENMLDREQARLGIVIPPDFSEKLSTGNNVKIQVLIDGANATAASTSVGYVNIAVQNFSQLILMESMSISVTPESMIPFHILPRIWFNPELKSAKFLIPGLIGFILMMMAVVSTALSVVREKERGTMEQILVSPLKPVELIIGKTVPYILTSLIAAVLILVVGYVMFDVYIKGSILLFFLVTLLYIICSLAMGLLISTIANSQQVAFMASILTTMLPAFILSGFVFPIRNMPFFIQILTCLFPIRFFLSTIRGIILKGTGFLENWQNIFILAMFSIVLITISSIRLKREFL